MSSYLDIITKFNENLILEIDQQSAEKKIYLTKTTDESSKIVEFYLDDYGGVDMNQVCKVFEFKEVLMFVEFENPRNIVFNGTFTEGATFVVFGEELIPQKKVGYNLVKMGMLRHYMKKEPESPDRIIKIHDMIAEHNYDNKLVKIEYTFAKKEHIKLVHDSIYVDHILDGQYVDDIKKLKKKIRSKKDGTLNITDDVYYTRHTAYSASLGVGATVEILTQLLNGKIESGFSIIRPPVIFKTK